MASIHYFRTREVYEFYLGIQLMSIIAILFLINYLNIPGIRTISVIHLFLIFYTLYIVIKLVLFLRKVYFQNTQEEVHPNFLVAVLDGAFLALFINIMIEYLPNSVPFILFLLSFSGYTFPP